MMLQEICMRHNLQEDITEPPLAETGATPEEAEAEAATAVPYTETSI